MPSPLQPSSSVRRLAAFRQLRVKPPLEATERILVWILGLHLAFLPWPLATMHPIPQAISWVLSVAGFTVATRRRGRKVMRFPVFWIGAILLGYVMIQALNPDWQYFADGHRWWLAGKNNVRWLPTSIEAPFGWMNPWRQAIIYSDIWLLLCSVWIGITRRRSLVILVGVIASNGLLLTGLLGLQWSVTGSRFPWPLTTWTSYDLAGSFISRNHAGAYLALGVFCALALSMRSLERAEQTLRKSSPAGAFGIAALVIGGGVLFTLSRGAVLTLALAVIAFLAWFFVRRRRQAAAGAANRNVTAAIATLFAVFLLGAVHYLDFSQLTARFNQLATLERDPSVAYRLQAHHAAFAMFKDQWSRGVGAGGFRYLFVDYVRRYPEIYQGGHLFWEHAHCDWLEIPIELGITGDLLILTGVALVVTFLWQRRPWSSAVAMSLLWGCSQTLVHAWFDFPFQCPAILGTWAFMVAAAAKWLALSEARSSVGPDLTGNAHSA